MLQPSTLLRAPSDGGFKKPSPKSAGAANHTMAAKPTPPPPAHSFEVVDWKEVDEIIKGHNPVGASAPSCAALIVDPVRLSGGLFRGCVPRSLAHKGCGHQEVEGGYV